MKAAKITAKLRDAVPVCLYAEGNELARYKNIELPDSIKDLEIMDFHFDIDTAGWISFRLHFEPGILPEELPVPKPPVTREQKRAAKAQVTEIHTADLIAAAAEVIVAAGGELTAEPAPIAEPTAEHSEATELTAGAEDFTIRFDVPCKKRGKLAQAIGEAIAREVEYLNPPSYAYQIGAMTLDREGILHGPTDMEILLPQLAERGFLPAE
jgi:hypothetical protein